MDDMPIQVQSTAIQAICGRLTEGQLAGLRRSVEQACLMPRQLGWDRKATAHAEIFGLLADAADHPHLARLSAGDAAGAAYEMERHLRVLRFMGRLAAGSSGNPTR